MMLVKGDSAVPRGFIIHSGTDFATSPAKDGIRFTESPG